MKHYKEIEITTGMIIARVFCEDGRRVALKFFSDRLTELWKDTNTPETLEKRCKEAHDWADKTIEVCNKYEIKAGEE